MNSNDISKLYDEKKFLIADKCIICNTTIYHYGTDHNVTGAMIERDPVICSSKRPSCKSKFEAQIRLRPPVKVIGEEPKTEKPDDKKKGGKCKKNAPEITEANEMKD